MNILREYRRIKKKSLATRISLIFTFSVILIVSTYAWFGINQPVQIGGLEGKVTSWDVSYFVEDKEVLDEIATITIDELYPGMPEREDVVNIYNRGEASTKIYYELISVKVFGVEVLDMLKEDSEISTNGNTTNIFSTNQNFPFNISYTYDKDYLNEIYEDDENTPNGKATFKYNVNWPYREGETQEEIEAKDFLDTKFGKDAYTYYEAGNSSSSAVVIKVRITSNMIHPSLENGESGS